MCVGGFVLFSPFTSLWSDVSLSSTSFPFWFLVAEELQKHKHSSFSLAKKMEILTRLSAGEGPTALGRLYGVNESSIFTIRKYEDLIRVSFAAAGDASDKISCVSQISGLE